MGTSQVWWELKEELGMAGALCNLGVPSTGHTQWLLSNPQVFPSGTSSSIFEQPKSVGLGSSARYPSPVQMPWTIQPHAGGPGQLQESSQSGTGKFLWEPESECSSTNGFSMEKFPQCTSWDVCGSSLLAMGLRRDLTPHTHDPAGPQTTLLCKE